MELTLEDRYAADVFGFTYREFAEVKPTHYRWNLIAPAAVAVLRQARAELWSLEKVADHLHAELEETRQHLRRMAMSESVNQGKSGAERVSLLLQAWLDRFEPDAAERKVLARDLSRLLSSQLHWAAQAGENLDSLALALEGKAEPSSSARSEADRSWGPQWKD